MKKFDIENWLWKYNFGTFWRTIIHCRIVLKQFPLSMVIHGQKYCILGSTTFKIPQQMWHYSVYTGVFKRKNVMETWFQILWKKMASAQVNQKHAAKKKTLNRSDFFIKLTHSLDSDLESWSRRRQKSLLNIAIVKKLLN